MAHQTFFSWEAPEFRHYEKTKIWYIIVGLVAAGLIAFMIWRTDYFGAITIGILLALFILFSHRRPRNVVIHLTNVGFHIDDIHIPYKHVHKFWIVDTEHHRTLNIHTNAYLQDLVVIQLGDQESEPIREFLQNILPEHDIPAPAPVQHIMHKIRF